MFKIGAFSKLSGVSIKTLRYYDKRGLLTPATIDKFSGYRYYSAEQLLTIQRIISLKNQGFTLEEIRLLLAENLTPVDVEKSFTLKQLELQHSIEEAQRQLKEIHSGLESVKDLDNQLSPFSIVLRDVKPQFVASIRDIIPRTHLCLLLDEIKQYVRLHGEDENRPLNIQWHNNDHEENSIDVEVALPIAKNIPSSNRVNVHIWPELKNVASLVHRCDPYHSSCPALAEVAAWISSNGYRPSEMDPIREIYLTADKDLYGKLRMAELLVPVEHV
ncbi:MerR family transcriptional regulator [Halalkalibacter sp. APA_J-10(15)]|uniref:MerR family transcriptional regulator n=1 Tax=Halalkalibacter sp. APA_J-10(15) TaxID=2933805 RepID=UPI001FF11887|nr:MerR family transcriptional regulator [Halalkalibacter sp. APA_J-10(15)]MCK0473736.1 MerR family transcriptional regulator [Halalkalibacter sp. APA_J-10(15)]